MTNIKVVVEKHPDSYVVSSRFEGVVVGEGDTYETALSDVTSAIQFHIKTFGKDVFELDSPILDAYVTETGVTI